MKIVELAGLPPGGDITDWFEARPDSDAAVAELLRIVDGTDTYHHDGVHDGPRADQRIEDVTSAPSAQSFPLTDAGNGEFFASQYGNILRFDHRQGRWLKYGNHRWIPDIETEVRRLARDAARERYRRAAQIEDLKERAHVGELGHQVRVA